MPARRQSDDRLRGAGPSPLRRESRRSDHWRSDFQKQALLFLQHLLGSDPHGRDTVRISSRSHSRRNGLATLQVDFFRRSRRIGAPQLRPIFHYGRQSAASSGTCQPVSCQAQANTCTAAGVCYEPVTDAAGNTAMVEEQGVTRSIASPFNDQEELARSTGRPRRKIAFSFATFTSPNSGDAGGGNGIAAGDWVTVPSVGYSIGADWTHTFTPNFVDQLRYGFQEAKVPFEGGAFPNCVVTNFGACPAQMSFTGWKRRLEFRWRRRLPARPHRQGDPGAEQRHLDPWPPDVCLWWGVRLPEHSRSRESSTITASPIYGTLSNLLGAPDAGLEADRRAGVSSYAYLANGNLTVPYTEPDVAAYFQDDWKVFPR